MPREVQDNENTIWSCVEAYAGLKTAGEETPDAAVDENQMVEVVCTPSGGAQTVRLKLKSDWETALSDEDLLAQIQKQK
jgi:hypothetical protein